MSYNLKQLRQDLADKKSEGKKLLDAADAEGRALSEDEEARLEAIEQEVTNLQSNLTEAEEQAEKDAQAAKRRETFSGGSNITRQHVRAEDDPLRGFANFGEFAMAVKSASRPGNVADERLFIGAAPTTYGNEGTGADGGFLVPPEFSQSIYAHSLEEEAFLPMTDNTNVSGNSMTFPRDETTPWGTTGIQAYWDGEADQMTQTKPNFGQDTLRLHRLTCLVPVTEELMADTGALAGYLPRKTSEKIRWKTNDALVNGTGAGQPTGIATANCLVEQAADSGQTADTITASNVLNMFSRCTNPGRAVWLIHPDAFPQLPQMSINNQPVFTPPGTGLQQTPAGSLLGRPVMMTDTCQTVGDAGDIYLVDWQGLVSITKAGGIETATSIHLWFDYNVMAFRAIFRVDAQPWLRSAISPANGSTTRSPFVNLAART